VGSFFDTIHYHLEKDEWGSKYPLLFIDLYQGTVSWQDATLLIETLIEVRGQLKDFKPQQVIWTLEDLSQRPPWGDNISNNIISLSEYFRTSDTSDDFFDVIIKAAQYSHSAKADIEIK
jgi:hypothetical protein